MSPHVCLPPDRHYNAALLSQSSDQLIYRKRIKGVLTEQWTSIVKIF